MPPACPVEVSRWPLETTPGALPFFFASPVEGVASQAASGGLRGDTDVNK